MIRSLLLCEYPSLNGGEQSILALVEQMGRDGIAFTFAAPARGPLADELKQRGIDHIAFDVFDNRGDRKPLGSVRERLHRILVQVKPTLLHANSLATARISGPVSSDSSVSSIGHLRDIIKLNRTAIRDINRHHRLLAVSRATRDWHVRQRLTAEEMFVVYNGVDIERFRPRDSTGYLHAELGLPDDAVLALTIGQIGMRKGIDITLNALRQVVREFSNLHLLIVGERNSTKDEAVEYERQLHYAAGRTPLNGHVHFLGRRSDSAELLGEATVLIHSARQEPLGRVLLESAAAGVPAVATRVGGTEEIFPPEARSAILIPPDDPIALVDALRHVLVSPALRSHLSAAARRQAVQRFRADTAAKNLLSHYRQSAGNASR